MNKYRVLVLVLMAMAVCLMSSVVGGAEEMHITLVGNYAKVEDARGVAVAGNYAYVVDENNGLVIVDISNPATPIRVGSYDSEYATGVTVSGSYAYFVGVDGLVIFDISNPAAPMRVGSYDVGVASGIAVSGSYAYIVNMIDSLVIIDISNPAAPVLAGSFDTTGYAFDVAVLGNYAYVADYGEGLVIFDISNPAAPMHVASYDTPSKNVQDVAVSGSYAYVADGTYGLFIVDISNPAAPMRVGSYDTTSLIASGVAVSGSYAYVADWANGLVIVDISNPAAPILAGSYDTAGYAEDVAISGNYAYVADGSGGLVVLHIVETGSISVSSNPILALGGICLFVLLIINIVLVKRKKSASSSSDEILHISSSTGSKDVPQPVDTIRPKGEIIINTSSAFGYKGATILHKIKIENPTSDPIGDIKIHLFVPDVFLLENKEKSISMLEPGESKTVTFEIRPTGECGDCNVSGRVNYYDYSTKKRQEIDLETKSLSIVCPLLKVEEIKKTEWRNITSHLVRAEETTREISMPAETLFSMASRVVEDVNMFMLEPEITSTAQIYNGVARFYGEGVKELKYAAQIEVVGGAKKSKLILKAWAEREDALTGFYHGILDELEKRVQVKGYINDSIVQNYYHYGDNIGTQVKDSFVYKSNVGNGDAGTCPQCGKEKTEGELFCSECGTKF